MESACGASLFRIASANAPPMSVTNTIGSPTTRSHKRLEMLRERPCHFLGVHSRVKVIRSYNDGIAEAPTFGNGGFRAAGRRSISRRAGRGQGIQTGTFLFDSPQADACAIITPKQSSQERDHSWTLATQATARCQS